MKILHISRYGSLNFTSDAGCTIDGWTVTHDADYEPGNDELMLGLLVYLQEVSVQRVLFRAQEKQVQTRLQ